MHRRRPPDADRAAEEKAVAARRAEPQHRVPYGVGAGRVLTSSALLTMQRSAGNRAVAALIAGGASSPTLQRDARAAQPERHWIGTIKGGLNAKTIVRHTLRNPTDRQITYTLYMTNMGYTLLSARSRFRDARGKPDGDRDWIQATTARGEATRVTLGLLPQWTLTLEFFGERDHRTPDQSYVEGTMITSLD